MRKLTAALTIGVMSICGTFAFAATVDKTPKTTGMTPVKQSKAVAKLPSWLGTRAVPADLRSKTVSWSNLSAGDCVEPSGTLTFYSDGTGVWSTTTYTNHTHSGDTWRSSFQVMTAQGAGLFNLGQWNSPRMDDGNPPPRYNWGDNFAFNPELFDAIGLVNQSYSC